MNPVYAFEYSACTFESAYGVESLHATKRGAYEAMRAKLVAGAVQDRDDALRNGSCFGKGWQGNRYAAWRVRVIEVLP